MRLSISTPFAVVTDEDDVAHVRAEDASGAFGILPGHTAFLTALAISVVTWRDRAGAEHHVAVRGGLLEVTQGSQVSIATREAIANDDLRILESEVIASFHRQIDEERAARADAQRLYLAAIRQIYRFLKDGAASTYPSGPDAAQFDGLQP
jgi:F-type H+-transporting ATPase subunit epsilon